MQTKRPPIYAFRAFEPSRVSEVRKLRESAWLARLTAPDKKPRKSTPSTPKLIAGVPLEHQALMALALKSLKL